ncbi:MAG: hypothetical protein WCQ60_02855 [bacterium]
MDHSSDDRQKALRYAVLYPKQQLAESMHRPAPMDIAIEIGDIEEYFQKAHKLSTEEVSEFILHLAEKAHIPDCGC